MMIQGNPLDILIPVYNEGENIVQLIDLLDSGVKVPFRVLICYDYDEDSTLPVLETCRVSFEILKIKNQYQGPHGAIMTGFERSDADCVIVLPADDNYNISIIDKMYDKFKNGNDIVVASRFMKGGSMRGGPWLKTLLCKLGSFSLYLLSSTPARDASNAFRLFSRRVLDTVLIESSEGFTFSLELLVKCTRLKWKIDQVPAKWLEREKGKSRFKVMKWLPYYLRWYLYGLGTTWLRKGPETVRLKKRDSLITTKS
jgi:dolichol-phosphate mannosyltransferase